MKQKTISCGILTFLFYIAVLSIGMYSPNREVDSFFSYSNPSDTLSSSSGNLKRMDATDELFGEIADEIPASISSGTRNAFSHRIFPLVLSLSMAVQPFIPLFIWVVYNALLRNEFIDRMYVILFIHNSDGKKRDLSRHLMAK